MTSLQALRVLVLEDESLIAMMIEDMLQELGCSVAGSAATVEGAIKLIQKGDFDFALLDMNLGGRPAEKVAEALIAGGVPFAFATGYGQQGLPSHLQGQPVLQKPFLRLELEKVLRNTLDA